MPEPEGTLNTVDESLIHRLKPAHVPADTLGEASHEERP